MIDFSIGHFIQFQLCLNETQVRCEKKVIHITALYITEYCISTVVGMGLCVCVCVY